MSQPNEPTNDRRYRNYAKAQVVEDPFGALPIGTSLPLSPVLVGGSNAHAVPEGVTNWDFFQGALLAVIVNDPELELFSVQGTAVVVAPGLAVTATHVLERSLPRLQQGTAGTQCLGIRSGNQADIWRVRSVSTFPDDDLAWISLELQSPVTPGWAFTTLPVTTRCPKPGEHLTVIGFQFPEVESDSSVSEISFAGELYAATGTVVNTYFPIHDNVLLPYPTIEIQCGSLGGMSGGAVIDGQGFVLGITSRGLTHEDGRGPTFASWIIQALNRTVQIPWPPGVYPESVHILDIPEQALHIQGRHAIEIVTDRQFAYRVWFE